MARAGAAPASYAPYLPIYLQLRECWKANPLLYIQQRFGVEPTWQQRQILAALLFDGGHKHVTAEQLHVAAGKCRVSISPATVYYNPLIPDGEELVATVMFEIDDPVRRGRALGRLGGIENTMFIKLGDEKVMGVAEQDQDRTNAEGKASSVQFVHFPFTPAQIAKFRTAGQTIIVGMEHPNYAHMAVMPDAVRQELAKDFD